MSESHCRIRAGRASAGESTSRGEVQLCHTVATETATRALLPMVSVGGVRGVAAIGRGVVDVVDVVGLDDESDAPRDAVPHETSSTAAVTAPEYTPTLVVTSPVSTPERKGTTVRSRRGL